MATARKSDDKIAAKKRGSKPKAATPGAGPAGALRLWRSWRVLRIVLLLALIAGFLGVSTVAGLFLYYTRGESLPTIDQISEYHPKVVTRVLASDGQLIGELFEERRTVVPLARIPRHVINAFIAAEDAHFFEHPGVNFWAMVRAMAQSVWYRRSLRGASTITQQLVKTYVLKSNERSLRRKVQEMYLALRLERMLSKEEILWLYLNQISFGHGRFGIEEAARYYFGKSVSDLDAGEAAVLASLPKAPEEFGSALRDTKDPKRQTRAKERQRYVLSQMARYHFVSIEEADRLANAPIQVVKEPPSLIGLAPEFVDEAERALVERFGQARLPYLGLNVRTTCDINVQRAARQALEQGLMRIDERQGYRGRLRHLTGAELKTQLESLKRDFPSGPGVGKTVEGVVLNVVDGEGGAGWASIDLGASRGVLPLSTAGNSLDRYNPKGLPASRRFVEGDTLRVRVQRIQREGAMLSLESGPQSAVLVLDTERRHVLAMIGGYGYARGYFNRALRAKRQPGSAFKPFVFATAFESRKWTAASVLNDSPQVYDLPDLKAWAPKNASDHRQFMGPVRLRVALAHSLNTVASQLIYDLKPEPVIATARALGIESPLESNYALALGSPSVSLIELTNAYASLAARGRRAEPLFILQIGDEKPAERELAQVISPELAFLMSHVLTSVVEDGTASSIKGKLKRPIAGKTGTTNSNKDAWFVGYTPDVVAGVWVGFDDSRPLGEREQGARTALPIWLDTMQAALRDRPPQPFVQPAGIVVERIDPSTGKRAAASAPSLDEVFLTGTEPQETALAPGERDPNTFNMDNE